MMIIDADLDGRPVLRVEDTDILYSFWETPGLTRYQYGWRGLRNGKVDFNQEVWVDTYEHFIQLLTCWNDENKSFVFMEVL